MVYELLSILSIYGVYKLWFKMASGTSETVTTVTENLSSLSQSQSSSLRKWAVKEMRFHTSSYSRKELPTEGDFERLCRMPLSNVWEFLLERIRSAEHVKQVKANLLLQKSTKKLSSEQVFGVTDDDDDLGKRKQRLETEKASCLGEVIFLERESKQVSTILEDTTHTYEKSAMHLRNFHRKKCLLKLACRRADEKVAEFTEYVNRLDGHVDSIINKRKESDKNNYTASGVALDSQSDLETENCHDVRLVCEEIGQYLHAALISSGDRQAIEDTKTSLLERVEELHSCYSIHTITNSLATHTIQAAKILREDTVRVNIESDAKDLSFSMDRRGHLQDESKPPSVHKSVQKLLQASNLNHVMRWFEEQNYLNESWKIEAQLDNMKAEIHKLIVKSMGGNPDTVTLAEEYVDLLLHLASESAVAPCLKQEMDILLNKIGKTKVERDELRHKLGKIEEFKEIVEKKQYLIGSLARYNSAIPSHLEKYQNQCKSYLSTRPVHCHLDLVEQMTSDLCGSLQKEVLKFHPLPFVCFLSLSLNSGLRTSALDLSIAPSVVPGAQDCLKTYSLLCQALHCPSFKSPDHLLVHILHVQSSLLEAHLCQMRTDSDRKAMCKETGVQDNPQSHRDLLTRSEEQDQHLKESLIPQLTRLEGLAQRWARKVAKSIPASLEAWWEQPAQHTTPWLSVDGLTFDQWMKRFKAILAQVHKKHKEKQHNRTLAAE